jgi:DsbC/DsbD-like thiol-disulfide interchange protein
MRNDCLARHVASVAITIAVLAHAVVASSAPVKTGHVTAELVAEQQALVPGETATVALRLAIEPGWHTYWRNPGESGLPTTLEWRLPPGYAAGSIAWPAPRALPAGPLVNYGYQGQVFHLVALTVPRDARPGTDAALAARADWLVCKETCIPEGADLTLTLPIAERAGADARWQARIAKNARRPSPRGASWNAPSRASGATITLQVAPLRTRRRMQFFADREREIEPSSRNDCRSATTRVDLLLPVVSRGLGLVVEAAGRAGGGASFRVDGRIVSAVAIDVPVAGTRWRGRGLHRTRRRPISARRPRPRHRCRCRSRSCSHSVAACC